MIQRRGKEERESEQMGEVKSKQLLWTFVVGGMTQRSQARSLMSAGSPREEETALLSVSVLLGRVLTSPKGQHGECCPRGVFPLTGAAEQGESCEE